MKLRLAVAGAALVFACSASAQIAPELLGGGNSSAPMYSEPFYRGAEGFWVLVRERANNGYHCSVNFITPENIFSLRGPGDADMARKNHGAIWFVSKAIPSVAKPETVKITLTSNGTTTTVPSSHVSSPGQSSGALLLVINVQKTIQEKPDSNELAVQLEGKEVFRSKLVALQDAYRTLELCMNKLPTTYESKDFKSTYSYIPTISSQDQLNMPDDILAIHYGISIDDPKRKLKISDVRQMIRDYREQLKALPEPQMPSFAPPVSPTPSTQQRMCSFNNGHFGGLIPC